MIGVAVLLCATLPFRLQVMWVTTCPQQPIPNADVKVYVGCMLVIKVHDHTEKPLIMWLQLKPDRKTGLRGVPYS